MGQESFLHRKENTCDDKEVDSREKLEARKRKKTYLHGIEAQRRQRGWIKCTLWWGCPLFFRPFEYPLSFCHLSSNIFHGTFIKEKMVNFTIIKFIRFFLCLWCFWSFVLKVYLSLVCYSKIPQLSYKQHKLISHSFGGWKSKIRGQHGQVLVRNFFWVSDGWLLLVSSQGRKRAIVPWDPL